MINGENNSKKKEKKKVFFYIMFVNNWFLEEKKSCRFFGFCVIYGKMGLWVKELNNKRVGIEFRVE